MPCHTERELDGIWCRIYEHLNDFPHILNALQEAWLIEEAVIYRHIKAATGLGIEKTIEAKRLHVERQRNELQRANAIRQETPTLLKKSQVGDAQQQTRMIAGIG